jgi:hypothetical protein
MRFLFQLALGLMVAAGGVLQAQGQGSIPRQQKEQKQQFKQQLKQQKQVDPIDRFLAMSPAQRRQALQQLPPDRQQEILRRLRNLELLSDSERKTLQGRLKDLQSLPQERRQAVRRELQNLRSISPADRQKRLSSDELKQNFSPDELRLLNDVMAQPDGKE